MDLNQNHCPCTSSDQSIPRAIFATQLLVTVFNICAYTDKISVKYFIYTECTVKLVLTGFLKHNYMELLEVLSSAVIKN
jgi:hypothetical protein